jgi:hypothetical protein
VLQVVPILKTLYHAPDSNSHHIYMSLIILLILSEDDLFNKSVHETVSCSVGDSNMERKVPSVCMYGCVCTCVSF